jgi:hypothetical protein
MSISGGYLPEDVDFPVEVVSRIHKKSKKNSKLLDFVRRKGSGPKQVTDRPTQVLDPKLRVPGIKLESA